MAKRKRNIVETDAGNLIYYKWLGMDVIRHKGNTGKQAPVAKRQAGILGKASAISASLRKAFLPILAAPLKKAVLFRFNNAIQQWLRKEQIIERGPVDNLSPISSFSFYGGEAVLGYLSHFSVKRMDANGIIFHITDLDPADCISVLSSAGIAKLHIIVASINVKDPADTSSAELTINIPYTAANFPGQIIQLPLQTIAGHITVVAFSTNGRNVSIAGALYN